MPKTPILQIDRDQLTEWCVARNEPAYRGRQVRHWILHRRAGGFDQMTDLPSELRAALAAEFSVFGTSVENARAAAGGTTKLLVRLADGQAVECVLMAEGKRRTVCVSTQVGCGMACVFCASGLDGVVRNLEAYEIVEQFVHARNLLPSPPPLSPRGEGRGSRSMPLSPRGERRGSSSMPLSPRGEGRGVGVRGERLTHAVIMGMGEPLANLDNLLAALEVVCSRDGLNLGHRHVTISTVGLPKGIRQLAEAGKGYHLAVSLHAPDDALRSQLVPPNRKIGIASILEATDYFFERTRRQVTFEYVLLRDINDLPDHAQALSRLLSARKVHVNLIPYNPVEGLAYQTPRAERVHEFAATLRRAGLSVKVRKTKGRKIDAACGQLRLRGVDRNAGAAEPSNVELLKR